MINGRRILGLIPARGGSKRVPNKNMRTVGGQPLIYWTIWEAQKSKYLDWLAVSTDETTISLCASTLGIYVIPRPSHLATDESSSESVARHALGYMAMKAFATFDYLVLLQPTSPLRSVADIDGTIERAVELKADICVATVGTRVCGSVFVATLPHILGHGCFDDVCAASYCIPPERGLDIDTEADLQQADKLLRKT